MQKIRVEQMSLLDLQQSDGGVELHPNSSTTQKTKKQKKSTEPPSKYKVLIGGIAIADVVDLVAPTRDIPFWSFLTKDNRVIEATGNIFVEYVNESNQS